MKTALPRDAVDTSGHARGAQPSVSPSSPSSKQPSRGLSKLEAIGLLVMIGCFMVATLKMLG